MRTRATGALLAKSSGDYHRRFHSGIDALANDLRHGLCRSYQQRQIDSAENVRNPFLGLDSRDLRMAGIDGINLERKLGFQQVGDDAAKDHGEVALRVAEQLSRNYYTAYEEIRTLGLATSPSEKFAKLLLSWSPKSAGNDNGTQVKLTLTHEEIAEIIGTARETVSRLFSEFKRKQLLQLKGATLIIRNRPALEKIVQS